MKNNLKEKKNHCQMTKQTSFLKLIKNIYFEKEKCLLINVVKY